MRVEKTYKGNEWREHSKELKREPEEERKRREQKRKWLRASN